jgi:hypothetical protein
MKAAAVLLEPQFAARLAPPMRTSERCTCGAVPAYAQGGLGGRQARIWFKLYAEKNARGEQLAGWVAPARSTFAATLGTSVWCRAPRILDRRFL